MSIQRTHNFCSRHSGQSAGTSPVLRAGGNASACRQAAGVRPLLSAIIYLLLGLIVLGLPLPTRAAQSGDRIINRAELHSAELPALASSVAVTLQLRTRSTIEFLKYAPGVSGASDYPVPTTYHQDSMGSFTPIPAPTPLGGQAPINLTVPLPLLVTTIFHAGEPIFVKTVDLDQNVDRSVAETILVTITDPKTGDNETLRLTETGPDTGIFIGYIPTTTPSTTKPVSSDNGDLSVVESSSINARYIDKFDGSDNSVDAALVDPYGIVFDTITGKPVDGATIELIDATTGLPAVVLGDNGLGSNTYPSRIISGGTATDADGNIYSFPQGNYRFPYVAPGSYILRVTPPGTYTAPSTVTTARIQTLPGAPYTILEPGSRGEVFAVPAGPAIRVDIPLDPKIGTLWLRKTAGKGTVSAGEFLSYEIALENGDPVGTLFSTVVTDKLPPGFRYQKGSTRINGAAAADPTLSADGRTMTFTVGTIVPKATLTIRYVVAVGAGAKPGMATNTVTAATTPAVAVNTATAAVQVQEPFMMSRSLIMGRVMVGTCSDNPDDSKKGLEGIGIYLEDGTFVFSDKFGMFHFEGVRPGTHVVQLDLDSIPEGYEILPCEQNSRFAGRAYSQFVDLQGGTMWRTDFHLGRKELATPAAKKSVEQPLGIGKAAEAQATPSPEPVKEAAAPVDRFVVTPFKGEISLEMLSSRTEEIIDYRLPLQAHTVPLRNLRMTVVLPDGAKYVPGSSSFNGAPLPDPEITADGLLYPLEDATDKWRRELQFRAVVDTSRKAGDLVTRAALKFDTEIAANILTPEVTNILAITKEEKIIPLPLFVFRPHFPTFGDELSDGDKQELDALVAQLADKIVKRINVTGHTDNVRIAPRSRGIHADNRALSLARAKSVGRYLAAALSLPPEALVLNGSGEKEPIATNKTAAGRALNRRVEVKVTALQRIEITDLKIIKERSDLEKLETTGAPLIEKIEAPATLQPLILPEAMIGQRSAESGTEAGAAQPDSDPEQPERPASTSTQQAAAQPVANKDEHVAIVAVQNDGLVHYRIRLKNLSEPFQNAKVVLTIPDKLLYVAGTSLLAGQPTADPEVANATLVYSITADSPTKSLDLRLQAIPEGDEATDQLQSAVTATVFATPHEVRKIFQAAAVLTTDMQPITSVEKETASSAQEIKKEQLQKEVIKKEAQEQEIKRAEEAEEFIERVVRTGSSRQPQESERSADSVTGAQGIIYPPDRSVLTHQINAVRIVIDSSLKPQLRIDGKEVAADRIGFSMKDSKSGKSLLSYIGVDIGEPGEHVIELKGLDTFGNARFTSQSNVIRAGEIAAIKLVSTEGNIADGKTPVRIRVQLLDRDGNQIKANTELTIKSGDLNPPVGAELTRTGTAGVVKVETDGWIIFQPVTASGVHRFVLGYGQNLLVEGETYVKPKMRDWILVGVAEGTVGYNTLSGHMENLKASGVDEHLYDRERLALFAKGSIKGEWLLTMAYDSAKQRTGASGNALFQTIDPNAYYTLYGDATAQGYEAASQRKLYLKIERDQFYALFGDYDTGLTVTELSRYSRRLNGIKSEYRSKGLEITAFGSQTGQAFVKDELRGDGTSGLYRLSRRGIVLNSETIAIESRDRFHSEIVTDSRRLTRFVDYSIDYESGTIFFKSPVASKDEQLNPVYIVVDYEIADAGNDALTYGGRAGTTLLEGRVKAGATYIHEGHVSGASNLYGIDTTVKLGPDTKARAEFATTATELGATRTSGNAYLAEVTQTGKNLEGKVYYREQESGFGLGQQKASESATRKYGAEATYKPDQKLAVGGQAYRQQTLATGAVRDFMESLATYTDKEYSGRAGLRYVNDSLANGSNNTSVQGTVGASWKPLNQKLTLRADHEQSLFKNDNVDFPTRTTLGADYLIGTETLLFAQEELTSGSAANSNTTRVGFKATPWSGGSLISSVVNDMRENSDRTFATVGLAQKWQLTSHWAVDGGLDHNQTIRKKAGYQLNANVPPVSGGNDFTAISLGANYTERKLAWSNRIEYRNSDQEDKWGIITGVVNEQGLNWGWTSRLQLLHSQASGGSSKTDANLRLGLAYRPPVTRWIVLDRLDLIASDERSATAATRGKRIINNLNANYRPDKQTQLSLQYGAKYVLEKIDDRDYSGFTDLMGIEGRYDLTKAWDIGLRGSQLHTWESSQFSYSIGPSIGYNVMENAWISCGYNIVGFHDKDFSAASYTAQGPFVQFRFKFDQNSVKDGLKALNQ